MNSEIQDIIESWIKSPQIFSFERRCPSPVNPMQTQAESPNVYVNFIIDVGGFFEDKDCKKPIKLHHEEVVGIPTVHISEQAVKDFVRKLDNLVKSAHEEFESILTAYGKPIYTSDPLHMKDGILPVN